MVARKLKKARELGRIRGTKEPAPAIKNLRGEEKRESQEKLGELALATRDFKEEREIKEPMPAAALLLSWSDY